MLLLQEGRVTTSVANFYAPTVLGRFHLSRWTDEVDAETCWATILWRWGDAPVTRVCENHGGLCSTPAENGSHDDENSYTWVHQMCMTFSNITNLNHLHGCKDKLEVM